jgi:hypothetical protein
MQQCSTSSTYGLPCVNDPNGHSLVQKFGAKESDMQPEQEIIFQLDTSYMLLGSGAALHQQYHWYSGNVLG